jgi:4'-phosphopantetheinyl transferase
LTDLRRGQAHIWTLPVAPADDGEIERLAVVLSDDEKARVERISDDRNRREYQAAHILTRLMLSSFSDVAAPDWRFDAGKHGRPEPLPEINSAGLRFNLSHASGLVACAVTRQDDIGVDVEWWQRSNCIDDIAEKKFSRPEFEYLEAAVQSERQHIFFSFWTLKESYIKAIGKGLVEPLDGFAFTLDPLGVTFLKDNGDASRWGFDLYQPTPDHLCALSLAHPCGVVPEIIRRTVNWDELNPV